MGHFGVYGGNAGGYFGGYACAYGSSVSRASSAGTRWATSASTAATQAAVFSATAASRASSAGTPGIFPRLRVCLRRRPHTSVRRERGGLFWSYVCGPRRLGRRERGFARASTAATSWVTSACSRLPCAPGTAAMRSTSAGTSRGCFVGKSQKDDWT